MVPFSNGSAENVHIASCFTSEPNKFIHTIIDVCSTLLGVIIVSMIKITWYH